MCADDCLYMEAFERMLDIWSTITCQYNLCPNEFNENSFVQIFNTYLQCHLSPPDGSRGAGGREITNEEINSNEADDRTKFNYQLHSIGKYFLYLN